MKPRAIWPTALVVVVAGSVATIGAVASCGDDTQPQECTVEGVCPPDGKICIVPNVGDPCCPVCPVNGACSDGCELGFPPV